MTEAIQTVDRAAAVNPADRMPSFLRAVKPVLAGTYRESLSGIRAGVVGAADALGWAGDMFEDDAARSVFNLEHGGDVSVGIFVPRQPTKQGILFFCDTPVVHPWAAHGNTDAEHVNTFIVTPNRDAQMRGSNKREYHYLSTQLRDEAWKPATLEEGLRRLPLENARDFEYTLAEYLVGGHPDMAAFKYPDFCPEGFMLRQSPNGTTEVFVQMLARMKHDGRYDAVRRVFRPKLAIDGTPGTLESWYETRTLKPSET